MSENIATHKVNERSLYPEEELWCTVIHQAIADMDARWFINHSSLTDICNLMGLHEESIRKLGILSIADSLHIKIKGFLYRNEKDKITFDSCQILSDYLEEGLDNSNIVKVISEYEFAVEQRREALIERKKILAEKKKPKEQEKENAVD